MWAKIIFNSFWAFDDVYKSIFIFIIAYWATFSYKYLPLPYNIQNGLIGIFFLHVGYLLQKHQVMNRATVFQFILCLFIWVMALLGRYAPFTLVNCAIEPIQYITSSCACIFVFAFSQLIERERKIKLFKTMLQFIGTKTAIILAFHIVDLNLNITKNITQFLTETENHHILFLLRFSWCMLFVFVVPKIKYINKFFGY